MPVVRSDERDEFGQKYSDDTYKVNAGGMYEPSSKQLQNTNFPAQYERHAVKLVFGALRFMRPHWYPVQNGSEKLFRPGYQVVCMVRHPEEVRQSFLSSLEIPHRMLDSDRVRKAWVDYGRKVRGVLNLLKRRHDVLSFAVLNYRHVLDCPQLALDSLGWPIDLAQAALVIDPSMRRFKLSELTIGL